MVTGFAVFDDFYISKEQEMRACFNDTDAEVKACLSIGDGS
jgi:hypothetical protein